MIKRLISQSLKYLSLMLLMLTLGVICERNQWLPAHIVDEMLQIRFVLFDDPWFIRPSNETRQFVIKQPENMADGLIKLVHFTSEKTMAVSVIDNNGTVIHQWPIDWFTLWPEADHLMYSRQPKSRPGTLVHGAEILPDGDLVFNFEYLGMLRLDACGHVRWRLPQLTHHAITIDDEGDIWAPLNRFHQFPDNPFALHDSYYTEPFIARISPQGEVLMKKSVLEILAQNQYYGALYLSSLNNTLPVVKGDTLHLNDIDIFPAHLPQGFLRTGDIMISLRNINTVLIIEPGSWRIKHTISHVMLRQHDPDFIDGNSIAVFDNNNRFKPGDPNAYSRILRISLPDNQVSTVFQGSPQQPFFTAVLGKQQWLDNGNILFTDNEHGRVLEITADGEPVWQYTNLIAQGKTAVVQEAQRLPVQMDAAFFARQRQHCQGNSHE